MTATCDRESPEVRTQTYPASAYGRSAAFAADPSPAAAGLALQVDGIGLRCGGIRALRGVAFEAAAGRITAVIGPNGAGKTSVFDTITGSCRPAAGRIAPRARRAVWHGLILRLLLNCVGLRRCRVALSPSTPIAPEILQFFRTPGAPIREAGGMTEASGATTMQRGDASPAGTVGVPYPGVELVPADDGDIPARGDVVFRGDFRSDDATRDAIDADGRLHTGDVARREEGLGATCASSTAAKTS